MSVPPRHRFRAGQRIRLTAVGAAELAGDEVAGMTGVVHGFPPRCHRCVLIQLDRNPLEILRVFGNHIEAIP